jgi:hypothetical protein
VVGRFAFAVPGDLATPTGGYGYDRRMIAELHDLGWEIDLLGLGEDFPSPSEATRIRAYIDSVGKVTVSLRRSTTVGDLKLLMKLSVVWSFGPHYEC